MLRFSDSSTLMDGYDFPYGYLYTVLFLNMWRLSVCLFYDL